MIHTLILGGAGFIGSNLVREYIKENKKVIVFSEIRDSNNRLNDISDQIIIINGSLCDVTLLEKVFIQYEIEKVVHLVSTLIPSSSIEDYINEHEKVIIPTIRLMEIMRRHNVKKLIYLSSGGTVYGNYKEGGCYKEDDLLKPINYYGLSKCNLEELIKLEGRKSRIDYLILRPSNPFGRFQDIYGKQGLISVIIGKVLMEQDIEVWGDGGIIRDYIPIEYLCQYIVKLSSLNITNEVFNLGSGMGHSINEIIQIIENILGIKLEIKNKVSRSVDTAKVILNVDKLKSVIDVEQIDLEKSILNFL